METAAQGSSKPWKIRVAADDREAHSGVVEALRARGDVDLAVERLRIGDYRIGGGRVLIERKTLADFAASLIDGRLFAQAARLARADAERVALILEGRGADLAASGVRREALQGALITISVVMGIPVLRAIDADETARLIVYMARQLGRAAAGALSRAGYRPKRKRARQLYLLQSLPRVGPARARTLLDAFGGVEGVFAADETTLASLPGIGRATAKAIRWIARERGVEEERGK